MPPGFLRSIQNKITFNWALAWGNYFHTEQNNNVYLTKKHLHSFWTYAITSTKQDVKWGNCIPPYFIHTFPLLFAFDNIPVLCSMFPFLLNMWLCTKEKTLFWVNREKERRSYCKTGMKSSHDGPSSVIWCACRSPTAFHCVLHISIQEWSRVSHIWIF